MKRQTTFLIVLFLITPLQARIITVDDDGPADFNNIQAAIDDANDGDTIVVGLGTYAQNIDLLGKNITLTSLVPNDSSVAEATIIDGWVTFRGTEEPNCTLTGFRINGHVIGFDRTLDPEEQNHTHATISHCIIKDFVADYDPVLYGLDGLIHNCLFANISYPCCFILPQPTFYDCHGVFRNCTIDNVWWGFGGHTPGICTIENCIIVGFPAVIWLSEGAIVEISYSCTEYAIDDTYGLNDEVIAGPGNFIADPRFADPCNGDYHLKSAAGRWDPDTQTWVPDVNTSLCIDAGNPGCPLGDEPDPNGNRINMGAYGGTAQASKSPPGWALLSDMTNDRTNNFADLKVLLDYWLTAGQCLPADLDRSGFVDAADYSIFAQQFGQTASPLSGLSYNIGDCQNESVQTDSIPTLPPFSISVEGRYIYFEDVMYANCCPDELGLQIQRDGNHITLSEIAPGGMCDCMCYFPVTATLGPLEDGTYIIDVYDNYGQWRGNAEVTIDGSSQSTVNYQISSCDMGMSALEDEPNSTTSFTITVQGQYIHFEDIMVANCCPDKLEIETIIDGNHITINEIETTTSGCRCTCDFPVTATLGPLDDGTYTIEVFGNDGQSKGTAQITIGNSSEPDVEFQIGTCQSQASDLTVLTNSPTRFTITVDGLYIHFQDIMVANCCPEELGLQMTINNDLIVIYETENTISPCLCICDYPINATLGPFEAGTYTLEVYEDYSGFIGSVSITIGP